MLLTLRIVGSCVLRSVPCAYGNGDTEAGGDADAVGHELSDDVEVDVDDDVEEDVDEDEESDSSRKTVSGPAGAPLLGAVPLTGLMRAESASETYRKRESRTTILSSLRHRRVNAVEGAILLVLVVNRDAVGLYLTAQPGGRGQGIKPGSRSGWSIMILLAKTAARSRIRIWARIHGAVHSCRVQDKIRLRTGPMGDPLHSS